MQAGREDPVYIILTNYDPKRMSLRFNIELICNNFSTITSVGNITLNDLEKIIQDELNELKTNNNMFFAILGNMINFDKNTGQMFLTKLQQMINDLKPKQTQKYGRY